MELRFRLIIAMCVFALAGILAVLSGSPWTGAALALGGAFLALVILFFPELRNLLKTSESIKIGPTYMKFESQWTASRTKPIHTIIPTIVTDATSNEKAKALCERGREYVAPKEKGTPVDLDAAMRCFQEAAELDNDYWEPRINIAQILLLKGLLKESFAAATEVHIRFRSDKLAYVKAGLIMAKVLEQRMPPGQKLAEKRVGYGAIMELLQENLRSLPEHLTSRISLGCALLEFQGEASEIRAFILGSAVFPGFMEAFVEALKKEGLFDQFRSQFPDINLT